MSTFAIASNRAVPGKPWCVLHVPSQAVAPMDARCSWLDWADGKTALAYFATEGEAQDWLTALSARDWVAAGLEPPSRSPDGRGSRFKAATARVRVTPGGRRG